MEQVAQECANRFGVTELRQSNLGMLLGCGRKFELAVIEGNRLQGSRKTMLGTAFHRGLESLYRSLQLGERPDFGEAEGYALENLQTNYALADPAELGTDGSHTALREATLVDSGKLQEALAYYVQNVMPSIAAEGRPLGVEERLEFPYRGYLLNGTLDLIDGGGVLHDHKLTSGNLDPNIFPHNYWAQLARYVWFWTEAVGEKPKGIQLDMVSIAKLKNKDPKNRRVEFAPYEDRDVDTLLRVGKEMVDQALDVLETGRFARNGLQAFGGLCDFCPFSGAMCLGTCSTARQATKPALERQVANVA